MLAVIGKLWSFMQSCRSRVALFLLAAAVEMTVLALAPLSFKFIIDRAIIPGDREVFALILLIIGTVGIFGIAAGVVGDRLLAGINAAVQQRLRMRLFSAMQRMGTERFQATPSGEHVSRFSVDLPAIEGAMTSMMTIGLQSLSVVAMSAVVLFSLQWSMALIILLGAALIYLGPQLLERRARSAFAAYREEFGEMTADVGESVRGHAIIQGFSLQQTVMVRFADRLRGLFVSHYRRNAASATLDRVPMVSLLLMNFGIIGFGSYLALTQVITLGDLVAFFTIYTSMGNAVYNLTAVLPSVVDARVSLDRVTELLDMQEVEGGGLQTVLPLQTGPKLRMDSLSYAYSDGREALKRVSLTIEAGSTVAFVGPSGSGKSTLLQLLLGLREPSEGTLLLNEADLRALDGELYRSCIGAVFQEPFLFRGTLLDNIRIGKPDSSMEEVAAAAQQADIASYIEALPDGYMTKVSEDGGNLSGGQKQRIALARALLRNPALLLLDEVTSALDPLSEAAVGRTISKLSRGKRTIVIVSHRLATIANADRIFVLRDGEVAEWGTHDELRKKRGLYDQMWEQQSGDSTIETGGTRRCMRC
ncbi:ABC transporter ATP-binding protein/permease [Paenibacillus sp. J5C_2022]|uniref:ABC transporter ATP-binding protein n=1 Tax=Paenibacillus sp. J5C2022 TaxID=2977129 RepID=UPI0021D3DAFE|nr:ABC transporter ATP-binding protein [Paenibacillus sp. J5C2022]MCU6708685.1 ABC transporter ATP-binding protein/permease [Paenibacillus sp. J5C2022]